MNKINIREATEPLDCAKVYYQTPEELKNENNPTPAVVHDDQLPENDSPKYFEYYKEIVVDPAEAIRATKANPNTVCITKIGDKYYIDYNDLRCFMDSCGECDYDSAVRNIITAHPESNLSNDNLGIVIRKNNLSEIDPHTRATMESSKINFEVYG